MRAADPEISSKMSASPLERITPALAAQAGEQAVAGARALAKNAYKIPMTQAMVRRTIASFA